MRSAPASTASVLRTFARLRAFERDTRASAGIELALGAVALISVAALCFDLYARVEADTVGARLAATMADYVSRGADTDDGTLDGAALEDLGEFLHERELGGAADLVFVISALRQPAGDPLPPVKVLWTDDTLRFGGDADVLEALAAACPRYVDGSADPKKAKDLDNFTDKADKSRMVAGEVVVVVEVCARLTGAGALTGKFVKGDLYRHHVIPARAPDEALPAPTHARAAAQTPTHAGLAGLGLAGTNPPHLAVARA